MLKNKKRQIIDFAKSIGIKYLGVCDADFDATLFEILKKRREDGAECSFTNDDLTLRSAPNLVLNGAKSVVVCLFPYFKKDFEKGNISRYASVTDYHLVAKNKLGQIAEYISENIEQCDFKVFCDTGASVDRFLAYKAGLGFFGKNNCLINDDLGSYFFIGYIITSCDIEKDIPLEKECFGCNECIKRCPGGAIGEDFNFQPEKCISYITQIKDISKEQLSILKGQESVWGCDVCQDVCPHNKSLKNTCLDEFLKNEINSLNFDEIAQLSGRQFKKQYSDFAFSWCGKDVILKNFVGGTYVKQRKNNG